MDSASHVFFIRTSSCVIQRLSGFVCRQHRNKCSLCFQQTPRSSISRKGEGQKGIYRVLIHAWTYSVLEIVRARVQSYVLADKGISTTALQWPSGLACLRKWSRTLKRTSYIKTWRISMHRLKKQLLLRSFQASQ